MTQHSQEMISKYNELWAQVRDARGAARMTASSILADFCDSIEEGSFAASFRGWAKNPYAYVPYTPWPMGH